MYKLTLSSNPFEGMSTSSYILVLAPHFQPPPLLLNPEDDPFVPFGRSILKFHGDIQFAPHSATRGLINTHERLLDKAGGVIVVICEPSKVKSTATDQQLDGLGYQRYFAREVKEYLDDRSVPTLLITIGVSGIPEAKLYDETLELQEYSDLEKAADRIFTA